MYHHALFVVAKLESIRIITWYLKWDESPVYATKGDDISRKCGRKVVTMDFSTFRRDRNRKETLASEMLDTVRINSEEVAGIFHIFGFSDADARKINVKISKFE